MPKSDAAIVACGAGFCPVSLANKDWGVAAAPDCVAVSTDDFTVWSNSPERTRRAISDEELPAGVEARDGDGVDTTEAARGTP